MAEDLEKLKQEEYYSTLMREINVKDFLKKPSRNTMKISEIEIPPIEPIIKTAQTELVIPPVGGKPTDKDTPPTPGGATAVLPPLSGKPAGGGALPPLPGGAGAGAGLPPLPGGGGAGLPPLPGAGGALPQTSAMPTQDKGLSEEDKDKILSTIQQIKDKLEEATGEVQMSLMKDRIMEDVKLYYQDLEKEIKSLKDRKIPEREFFDTEGTYKEHLYSMATRMLDDFLPQLFDEIPDYSFIATQVSRIFEDGTVADALITLIARVVENGMKYDFKVDVPVLNGLMQYPLYVQRGQKIIPLTKPEIKKELESLSYRKDNTDETAFSKNNKNMFKNIGENLNRKPNHQKWYDVIPNKSSPVGLAPDHKFSPQRGVNR